MKKHTRQIRLQTVFFTAFTGMAVLFLLIFIIGFYRYQSNILVSQELTSLYNQASSFQAQTDAEIEKMDAVSININYSSTLRHLLGEKKLYLNTVPLDDFADLCTTINGVDLKVDQINLYDFHGNILRVGESTTRDSYRVGDYPYVDNIFETGGQKVLSKPYGAYYLRKHSGSPEMYISLYRTYSDSHSNQTGVVETALRCKSIFRSVITYQNKAKDALKVHIYTDDGICIYPYNTDEESSFSYYDALKSADSLPYFNNPDTGEKEIVTSAVSS